MTWETAADVATTVTMTLAIPATFFALVQLLEMRRSGSLSALRIVLERLQEEPIRQARQRLISDLAKKSFESWTAEEREAADLALRRYNSVAILVENRLIPVAFVLPEWENSLILCWEAGQPLVKAYRDERGCGYWRQLETLYKRAIAARKSKHA